MVMIALIIYVVAIFYLVAQRKRLVVRRVQRSRDCYNLQLTSCQLTCQKPGI